MGGKVIITNQVVIITLKHVIHRRYDSHFWYIISGHIDVHSDRKQFDSVSYAETPNFDKTVNYIALVIFPKMGSKNQFSHTLLKCTSICHIVV